MVAIGRDRVFLGYALACGLGMGGMFAYIAGSSFVLQNVYGLSPQMYGIVFALNAAGLIIGAQVNGRIAGRIGPSVRLTAGLTSMVVCGAVLVAVVGSGRVGLVGVIAALFVAMFGWGFVGSQTPWPWPWSAIQIRPAPHRGARIFQFLVAALDDAAGRNRWHGGWPPDGAFDTRAVRGRSGLPIRPQPDLKRVSGRDPSPLPSTASLMLRCPFRQPPIATRRQEKRRPFERPETPFSFGFSEPSNRQSLFRSDFWGRPLSAMMSLWARNPRPSWDCSFCGVSAKQGVSVNWRVQPNNANLLAFSHPPSPSGWTAQLEVLTPPGFTSARLGRHSRERTALEHSLGFGFLYPQTCSRSARPPARPTRARPKESHEATNKADYYRLCHIRWHSHDSRPAASATPPFRTSWRPVRLHQPGSQGGGPSGRSAERPARRSRKRSRPAAKRSRSSPEIH